MVQAAADERLGELQDVTAFGDAFAIADVADPVMRQVGSDQHEVTGAERRDVVADVAIALRAGDEMQLVFGMEMPA